MPDRPTASAAALRTLFVLAATALLGIQVLVLAAEHLSPSTLFAGLLPLMVLSGAGTLGFTNVGMRVAVSSLALVLSPAPPPQARHRVSRACSVSLTSE